MCLFSFSQIKMNGKRFSSTLPSMYFLFLQISIAVATRCLQYKFLKEYDVSLENHVMKSIPDILPYACRSLCVHTTFCFSVNMKRKQESNFVTCELNNSSRVADPWDVIYEAGSEYHQMAVRSLFRCAFLYCECFPNYFVFFRNNFLPDKLNSTVTGKLCAGNILQKIANIKIVISNLIPRMFTTQFLPNFHG